MFVLLTALIPAVLSLPNPETPETIKPPAKWKDCAHGILNPTCVKLGAITLLERLNNKEELQLLPGVTLMKESKENEKAEDAIAAFKSIPANAEEKLDKFFLYRLGNYLDSHSLKFKLVDNKVVREARSMLGEARKKDPLSIGGKKSGMGMLIAMAMMMKGMYHSHSLKFKLVDNKVVKEARSMLREARKKDPLSIGEKKSGMGMLIAMAMMMKGTLMSLGLGGLAMLAGKALMTAMMSLLLSAIIGIKSLTSGGKSTTYEIVSKPVYSHSHSHSTGHEDVGNFGHSAYGRNLNVRRR